MMAKSKRDEPRYRNALRRLVTKLFDAAFERGHTWESLADKAGVSRNTVFYLANRNTRFPHYRTLELLAQAVGGSLMLKPGAIPVFATKAAKPVKRRRKVRKLRIAS